MAWWRRKQLKVSNKPKTGFVGEVCQFDIDASSAGKGCLEVEINGGSVACTIVPLVNRQYQVSFLAQEAKQHFVVLKFNGRNLPNKDFTIDIREGEFTATGPGLNRVPVNVPTSIKVCSAGRSTAVVSATITSLSGSRVEQNVVDKGDGSYLVEYTPVDVGTYTLEVLDVRGAGSGSLFFSKAYDISAIVVGNVKDYTLGKTAEFEIDTSRAGEGEVNVTINGEVGLYEFPIVSATSVVQNGVYLVTFTVPESDATYAVISFNSHKLPQNPVRLDCLNVDQQVRYDETILGSSNAGSGPNIRQSQPGNSTTSGSSPGYPVSRRDRDEPVYMNASEWRRRDESQIERTSSCNIYVELPLRRSGENISPERPVSVGSDDEDDEYFTYANLAGIERRVEIPIPAPRVYSLQPPTVNMYLELDDYADLPPLRDSNNMGRVLPGRRLVIDSDDESCYSSLPMTRAHYFSTEMLPSGDEDDPYAYELYEDLPEREAGKKQDAMPGLQALKRCTNGGRKDVYIVRETLVADVFALYKDGKLTNKKLSVEFVGEPGLDCKGLTRDLFTCFWREVSNDLFRGEDCLVPDLPLHRTRKESWKFECLGRILSHSVALTGTVPSILARSTLIKLVTDFEVDDKCLLDDFLLFVTTREKALLTKAMSDFSSLTDEEAERLLHFYTAHGFQSFPRGPEVKDQILTMANQELVEKPASLISKMREGIPQSHKAAFWQRLSAEDITRILQAQRPTPEKVTDVITTDKEHVTDDEDRTLYFLKEFVASLDFDTLTDFLIFVTGSVHQPDKIRVTFTKLTGLERRPISHTCFNLLEVPTSYSSIKEFRREFLAVLSSPEAFQYSAI